MAWQACALCPEALASGCRHAVAAAAKVTAAVPSPVQTRLKHAKFPGQHGHIYFQAVAAETALTRSNDGQIPDGHDVAGHQDTTAWPPAPGGEADLAGEVVAGGPLSPLSVLLFPGARYGWAREAERHTAIARRLTGLLTDLGEITDHHTPETGPRPCTSTD